MHMFFMRGHQQHSNVGFRCTPPCREYQANVLRTAKMFLKLGLQPHHSVGVLAFNSPEWFYSCLAAVHAG